MTASETKLDLGDAYVENYRPPTAKPLAHQPQDTERNRYTTTSSMQASSVRCPGCGAMPVALVVDGKCPRCAPEGHMAQQVPIKDIRCLACGGDGFIHLLPNGDQIDGRGNVILSMEEKRTPRKHRD